ncbi:MAG: response regulator [Acidobacteriota bacterium]
MSLSILIVDDEAQVRRILKLILERAGHTVREVETGQEALSACQATGFDLIITDLGLPDVNGIELIQRLKAQRPEQKILAVSGSIDPAFLEHVQSLGVQSMQKPLLPQSVLETVEGLCKPE